MAFYHHVLFNVSVKSLAMSFCSWMVNLRPWARGRLSSPLPSRQKAKCEVAEEWVVVGRRMKGMQLCFFCF